jgi:hypothetical protein
MSFLVNLRVTLGYTLFLGVLGVICATLGGYGAVLREQQKLIEEIKRIEGDDRREQTAPAE